mmetsp:Transcript_50457/g.127158  ORF Transcript_50457/g.127158 Transcript_50457/m.127158 type:complete len:308 (+) Transcript_50457:333-1256(+)
MSTAKLLTRSSNKSSNSDRSKRPSPSTSRFLTSSIAASMAHTRSRFSSISSVRRTSFMWSAMTPVNKDMITKAPKNTKVKKKTCIHGICSTTIPSTSPQPSIVKNWNKVNIDRPTEPQYICISFCSDSGNMSTFCPMSVVQIMPQMKSITRTNTIIQNTISTDSTKPFASIRNFLKARKMRRTLSTRRMRRILAIIIMWPPERFGLGSVCDTRGITRMRMVSVSPKNTTKKSNQFQLQSVGSQKKPLTPSAINLKVISVTKATRKNELIMTQILTRLPAGVSMNTFSWSTWMAMAAVFATMMDAIIK